jgi:hypothetical protein
MLGVGGEDAVVSHPIAAWPRDQRRESGQELEWLEHNMAGAEALDERDDTATGSTLSREPGTPDQHRFDRASDNREDSSDGLRPRRQQ